MARQGLSIRAYSRHRGCSHTAVSKAIAAGRITTLDDGSIDAATADAQWDANTDPSKQRDDLPGGGGSPGASVTPAPMAPAKQVPNEAIESVQNSMDLPIAKLPDTAPADNGEDAPAANAKNGQDTTYLDARSANEVIKSHMARVRLDKLRGELIDRSATLALVFELARRERDSWQNWPPRVAANMAAELNVEPQLLEQTLDKYLREHLQEMAELKFDPA